MLCGGLFFSRLVLSPRFSLGHSNQRMVHPPNRCIFSPRVLCRNDVRSWAQLESAEHGNTIRRHSLREARQRVYTSFDLAPWSPEMRIDHVNKIHMISPDFFNCSSFWWLFIRVQREAIRFRIYSNTSTRSNQACLAKVRNSTPTTLVPIRLYQRFYSHTTPRGYAASKRLKEESIA